MSYLKNTLNFASYSYDASTDTPALAKMKDGTVFEVATAGKVVGTAISGCTLGADSYLLVGDKVVYKNGGHELLSPKIKNGTTINVGTGGLFTKFKDANDYISQRVYTGVILNLLSTTVETSSIDVQNPCGGRLVIMGNGFLIDFSGTANTNCTLSGNNIYIDDFKVKSSIGANESALVVSGNIDHQNNIAVQNISATGRGIFNCGNIKSKHDVYASITSDIAISVQSVALFAYTGSEPSASLEAFNLTLNGGIELAGSNTITGAINTGGGQFNGGVTCSNHIGGAINTGGGQFHGGVTCSNYFKGAITTGGGQFNGGDNCQTTVNNTITGVGATFTFALGTKLAVKGVISGYTIAGAQNGIGVYNAATSAGVLRNQNTNILQSN